MTKGFIRFIAGAVCPSCKAQDKIAITPDDKTIYCISSDYKEHRTEEDSMRKLQSDKPTIFKSDDYRSKK